MGWRYICALFKNAIINIFMILKKALKNSLYFNKKI